MHTFPEHFCVQLHLRALLISFVKPLIFFVDVVKDFNTGSQKDKPHHLVHEPYVPKSGVDVILFKYKQRCGMITAGTKVYFLAGLTY